VSAQRRSVSSDDRGHWFPAYIGLGSNLDGPARQLEIAFELLGDMRDTRLIRQSSLYRSAPFGGVEQPDFVNAAASLLTQLSAQGLLLELQRIENERGRERGEVRWGPRVLDLDLLVYSNQEIDEPGLSVPHPGIGERNFVLLPLREIAPELDIPGLGRISRMDADSIEPGISRIG
jgi:2-amino-4-hydroxy-6-hydroxymethyldihydropteridine diphosphokinase